MKCLKCKCGSEMFNVATNDKFAMCSKCKTVYDDKGEEVKIESPFKDNNKIYITNKALETN